MPLKLDLKVGEKLIINGAVLENVGQNAKLLVRNLAAVLREKEILTQNEAVTPASRTYFSLQCAYIFSETREQHLSKVDQFLNDYVDACPSAETIANGIRSHVEKAEYYKAMKAARKLIAHEIATLSNFESGLNRLADTSDENTDISGSILDREILDNDPSDYLDELEDSDVKR